MARIEGPSPRRLIESISEKQVEAPGVEATPTLPPPPPGLMGPLMPPPLEDSGFSDVKKKPVRMSGRFNPGPPIPPREPFAAFKMQPGVEAKGGGGSLQIKDAEAKTETKAPGYLERMGTVAAMKDEQKAQLKKQIQAGTADPKMMAAYLGLLPPADLAAAMKDLKPKQIDALKAQMRAGDCPDNVAIGVGVRLASETDWAKKNPEVAKTMQKAFADGAIRVSGNNIAGLGMTSESGIELAEKLRRSPEALAATIAHESVHQHEGGGGCCSGNFDATPAGELKGMAATVDVWRELNPGGKDANLGEAQVKMLNELSTARKGGDKAFADKVLGFYTGFYQEKLKQLDAGKISKKEGPYLEKTEKAFREAWKAATK